MTSDRAECRWSGSSAKPHQQVSSPKPLNISTRSKTVGNPSGAAGIEDEAADGSTWTRVVVFGAPMRVIGEDYEALAKQVEAVVRTLLP